MNTKSTKTPDSTTCCSLLGRGNLLLLLSALLMNIAQTMQGQEANLSPVQLQQIERGYGLFIHFGVNTFNQTEWSDGTLPVESYNPTELDPDQWVRIAKEAGFRYIILITKHHDGFCLWDSAYTDYDVASSPVKMDVVKAVADACEKYGVELGLYYSLWDRYEPTYEDDAAYNEFMKKQLTELMTNYGDICELWLDGGWKKPVAAWGLEDMYAYVKEMQPNCLMAVNHTIGDKEEITRIQLPQDYEKGDPINYWPADFRIKDPDIARWDDPKFYERDGELHYLAFQHTICISDRWNWFQKQEMIPARPLDELEILYYWTTANDNLLIVNIPPDETGRIRANEEARILELADRLGIRGGETALPSGPVNLIFNQDASATSEAEAHPASFANDFLLQTYWQPADWAPETSLASLTIDFDETKIFDRITLVEKAELEDLGDRFSKQRTYDVTEFSLEIYQDAKWQIIYEGTEMRAGKIINLPNEIAASKLRLNILKATEAPAICHIAVAKNSSRGLRTVSVEK